MSLVRCAFSTAFACFFASLFAAVPAAAHAKPTVVVLPVRGNATSSFDSSVGKLIEEPLKRYAAVASLSSAMKGAHLKSASAGDAQRLGKAAGAAYVLVVEASGSKSKLQAKISLVDVASNKSVADDHYAMPEGKVTGEMAEHILSPIIEKLAPAAQAGDASASNAADKDKDRDKDKDTSEPDKLDPEAADAIDNTEAKPVSSKHWQPGYEE